LDVSKGVSLSPLARRKTSIFSYLGEGTAPKTSYKFTFKGAFLSLLSKTKSLLPFAPLTALLIYFSSFCVLVVIGRIERQESLFGQVGNSSGSKTDGGSVSNKYMA
jgi:hypothetical protein